MYVEDLFLKIRNELIVSPWQKPHILPFAGTIDDPWHKDFIESIGIQIDLQKPLSTKQSEMVLKIIRKVRYYITSYGWMGDQELTNLLNSPNYARPIYQSTHVPKEVRYIGSNKLAFRFKFAPALNERVRKLCDVQKNSWFTEEIPVRMQPYENLTPKPYRNPIYNIWIVPVFRFNIQAILALIAEEQFGKDQAVENYLKLIQKSINMPSTFKVDQEFQVILANVCDNPLLAGWITEVAEGISL